jgi:hypothetical protein
MATPTQEERIAVGSQAAVEDIQSTPVATAATTSVGSQQVADPTSQSLPDGTPLVASQGASQAPVAAPSSVTSNSVQTSLVGDGATAQAAQGTAAQSQLSQGELVSDQLTQLLQPGEDGETPTFAQPAVTAVEQMLSERGIGRSSIGGADITNAIIQSAIPLAQQNAAALQRRSEVNLNNQQQIQVQNLNNEQQANMATAQFQQQQLLTDASAENASRQFNSSSKQQTDQFMANLSSNIQMQNASRIDSMEQFNVSADNAVKSFNEQQTFARQSFNAQNATAIQQSNLQWRRQVATQNTANQQQSNLTNAQDAFGRKSQALAFTWQEARDLADQDWKNVQNNLDRVLNYETTIKSTEITAKAGIEKSRIAALSNAEAAKIASQATTEAAETEGYATLIGGIITGIADNWG